MYITSKKFIELTTYIKDANGKEIRGLVILRPGKHYYPTVDPKDPRVASQLRVLSKACHNAVSFDEELPQAEMSASVSVSALTPTPTPTPEGPNVSGLGTDEIGAPGSEPSDSADQGSWKVSRKGRH
jgi:hypothetical protein